MSSYSTQNPRSATIKFSSQGASHTIPCFYEGMQGKRLILEVSSLLGTSTAVTVEYNDALFLGEIVSCSEVNGLCRAEVAVEQILTGLQSLIALRARLLGEDTIRLARTTPVKAVA